MRKLNILLSGILLLTMGYVSTEYTSVGTPIDSKTILNGGQMEEKYRNLMAGDTLEVSFKGEVKSVCKNKGCWMKLGLDGDQEVMVKFKDYAFFVPKNIEGKEVIVNGQAYVEEVSVEEQRHYAEDAGATSEEIERIVQPKKTLSFMADGVKIKK